MIGKPPNLKLYVDSVIRQSPNRTTWCHSHDDIWDNIEPYKENSYVGHMTLNEIFLFCSRKGIKSKPFNKWWGRKTLSRHVNSFFKNESHVDFDNLPTHNDNGRYMKLSSVVEILYDLPIRNQISIIQTDKVLEVHPGGTRLALKDFYLDPVPVFLYSYEPIDFLEKITRDNIEILNPKLLTRQKVDYLLILSWNIKEEIIKQETNFRKNGGKFIIPFPRSKVLN